MPGAGTLRIQVLRGEALVATVTGKVKAAGDYEAKPRPTAAGKKTLKRPGKVKLTMKMTFTPTSGAAGKATGTVTLKR